MTWQERLLAEQDELQNRIDNLQAFILGAVFDTLPFEDQSDLKLQIGYMRLYYSVLSDRTARHCIGTV